LKEKFLDESNFNEATKKHYTHIFQKLKYYEELFDKDLTLFSPNECDELLKSYNRSSLQSVLVLISCFRKYLDFCNKDSFNYFATLDGEENAKKFVNKDRLNQKYFTREEVLEFENLLINPQDAVLLELFYWGLTKKEILNLKLDQVYENAIELGNRFVPINPESYDLIIRALDQDEYTVSNGFYSPFKKSPVMKINKTMYVVRPFGSTKYRLNMSALNTRLQKIKVYLGNPNVTSNSLRFSGMMNYLKSIEKPKSNDYQQILEHYGQTFKNWYSLKRNHKWFENIKKGVENE
jgi:hypothetical protein